MAIESYTFTGRVREPWYDKVNPIWWFLNDTEQTVDQAPTFYPTYPHWLRWVLWNIRNPIQNFRAFVIGVQDKNYTVTGKVPVLTVQRDDLVPPEKGFQYCYLHGGDLWFPRGFVSYSGTYIDWYFGWQPTGFFGLKWIALAAATAAVLAWFLI